MCCENLRAELTLKPHSFAEAKAELQRLRSLNDSIKNAAGDTFVVSAQSLGKVLSYKARGASSSADSHYAAVAGLEKLLRHSEFLYAEKPRNQSADIQTYNKYGAPFIFDGQPYLAKITAKSYASVVNQIVYSIESISVKKIGARGITETITKGQSLDSDANLVKKVTDLLASVNIEKGHLIDSLHLITNQVAANQASLPSIKDTRLVELLKPNFSEKTGRVAKEVQDVL